MIRLKFAPPDLTSIWPLLVLTGRLMELAMFDPEEFMMELVGGVPCGAERRSVGPATPAIVRFKASATEPVGAPLVALQGFAPASTPGYAAPVTCSVITAVVTGPPGPPVACRVSTCRQGMMGTNATGPDKS